MTLRLAVAQLARRKRVRAFHEVDGAVKRPYTVVQACIRGSKCLFVRLVRYTIFEEWCSNSSLLQQL